MQDPKDLSVFYCDVVDCGKKIDGKRIPFLNLPVRRTWDGDVGPGMIVCAKCARDRFGIDVEGYAKNVP